MTAAAWWAYAQTQDRWHLLAPDADHRCGLHAVWARAVHGLTHQRKPDGFKYEHCWLAQLAAEVVRLAQRL